MPENNFIYQDNFILAEQQEVSHDTSLSGTGMTASPLGVQNPLPYPMQLVATQEEASGTNILYVVTGSN